jgi:hypothetical protein
LQISLPRSACSSCVTTVSSSIDRAPCLLRPQQILWLQLSPARDVQTRLPADHLSFSQTLVQPSSRQHPTGAARSCASSSRALVPTSSDQPRPRPTDGALRCDEGRRAHFQSTYAHTRRNFACRNFASTFIPGAAIMLRWFANKWAKRAELVDAQGAAQAERGQPADLLAGPGLTPGTRISDDRDRSGRRCLSASHAIPMELDE